MPLPSYMTDNPTITPLKAMENRLKKLGKSVSLRRQGCAVHIEGLVTSIGRSKVTRAITMACEHADSYNLTLQATIPAVECDVVSNFENKGFTVVDEVDEDDERGAHVVVRRAAA